MTLNQSLAATVAGVSRLATAARSGHVVIDSVTGRRLQQALQDHIDQVDQWQRSAGGLTSALPLGRNWVADGMAAKVAARANGSDNSLTAVLGQYRTALTDAKDAVAISMANYQTAEQAVGADFQQIDRGDLSGSSLWSELGKQHGRAQ